MRAPTVSPPRQRLRQPRQACAAPLQARTPVKGISGDIPVQRSIQRVDLAGQLSSALGQRVLTAGLCDVPRSSQALSDSYPRHLRDVLATHEAAEHLSHIRRSLIVEGDVREILPRYLTDNPHTVIALAYFDLDLYEPTRHTIDALKPFLTRGSVLAFDQLAHAKWPGKTAAVRDTVGIGHGSLRCLPGRATPIYLRWGE